MNPAEKIQAAIDKLDGLRATTAPGPWEVRGIEIVRDSEGLSRFQALWVADIDPVANEAELIVTLHRTVDAQLAILRAAKHAHKIRELGNMSYSRPDGTWRTELEVAALDLAETVLGDSDA